MAQLQIGKLVPVTFSFCGELRRQNYGFHRRFVENNLRPTVILIGREFSAPATLPFRSFIPQMTPRRGQLGDTVALCP